MNKINCNRRITKVEIIKRIIKLSPSKKKIQSRLWSKDLKKLKNYLLKLEDKKNEK